MKPLLAFPLAAFVALAAAGCSDQVQPNLPEYGICGEVTKDLPTAYNRDVDVLFVIDTSPSMAGEQALLADNLDRFVAMMENLQYGLPNLRIGVVSADLGAGTFSVPGCAPGGDAGILQSAPRGDCQGPDGAFIIDIANRDGTRTRNYEGALSDTLACIADLGAEGCEFSQPLEAMRRALDGSNPENDGFLREDAFLVVVIVTDQDDCSAADPALFDPSASELGPLTTFRCFEYGVLCHPDEPRVAGDRTSCQPRADSPYAASVEEYATFLKGLAYDPNMVAVIGVFGNPTPVAVGTDGDGNPALSPSCETASASAAPGIRLAHFAELFTQRNSTSTICNEDFSDVFLMIPQLLARAGGIPCVEGDIDLDPETPGLQVECTVSEILYPGEDQQEETLIPECATVPPEPGTMPCWELPVNPNMCPDTATNAILEVHRSGASVPTGTHTIMRCFTGCEEP